MTASQPGSAPGTIHSTEPRTVSLPAWKQKLLNHITTNKKHCLYYLKFARFLATRGITPPLTIPAEEQEKRWQDQGKSDSDIQPEVYTRFNDSVEKLFTDILPYLSPDHQILEIGCNAGRSMNYLYHHGFHHLTGIEIGTRALEIFKETFPETYHNSVILPGNAVEEIKKLQTKSYDLVFTHSVLTNIGAAHNDFFREMTRVCRGYILTLESEGHWRTFPRDFEYMFAQYGYKMVSYRWLVWNKDERLVFPFPIRDEHILKNNTIRLFAPIEKALNS